jgi:DNA repair protein RadC
MPCRNRSQRQSSADATNQTDFSNLLFPDRGEFPSTCVHEGVVTVPVPLTVPRSTSAFNTFSNFVPVYQVRLALTGSVPLHDQPLIQGPEDVAKLLSKFLQYADREHLVSLMLDAKNHLIGITTISIGDLSSAIAHPREVFKPAILANAAQIIVAHNHPSGDPSPSSDDHNVTNRLVQAGQILGIEVLDHIVIGSGGRFVSLKEKGYM